MAEAKHHGVSLAQGSATTGKAAQRPAGHAQARWAVTGRGAKRERPFGVMNRDQTIGGIDAVADGAGDLPIRGGLANGAIERQGIFQAATDLGKEPLLSGKAGLIG